MSKITGLQAENDACRFLIRKGLKLVTKNFSGPQGEIDLIMSDNDTLVFVEVRLRTQQDYGCTLESITPSKQRRIIKTALYYLQQHELIDKVDCRFDVLGLENDQSMIWIKNAFEDHC